MIGINVGNVKAFTRFVVLLAAICALMLTGVVTPPWMSTAARAAEVSGPSAAVVPLPAAVAPAATDRKARGRTGFVLGLSWQPALCEVRGKRPGDKQPGRKRPGGKRPECVDDTPDRPAAKQFSLAGLWPVRNSFCKVPEALQVQDRRRDWSTLPAVPLAPALAARLAIAMPGTASGLERHQWLRSGSCQVLAPDAYFALQIRLLDAVNASSVGDLFRGRIGREVTEAEVKAAFDRSFAAGAGERVKMQCRKSGDRLLVTGLTIGLSTALDEGSDLGALIQAAAPTAFKCTRGVVDAAGRIAEAGQEAVGVR